MNLLTFLSRCSLAMLLALTLARSAAAGRIYQNFEPDNPAPLRLNSVGDATVQLVTRSEPVFRGVQSVKSVSGWPWNGFGVQAQTADGLMDLSTTANDRLTFWIYAMPRKDCDISGCRPGTENNVGVTFYDNSKYRVKGFEVWTTQTARYAQWSQLKVLFSQLPAGFNLRAVTRIEFKNYWPGTYYFDDIHAVREDRVYQAFEKEERSGSTDGEYGWKWNSADTAVLSGPGEPVYQGLHSWKLISTARWGGTGLQSQEKRLVVVSTSTQDQSFWHVDLNPERNDRLTFWVYALPENGMDNNLAVQFYDNGAHFTDATKVEVWTKTAARAGRWTRLEVLFADLKKRASDLDLEDINKIQIQAYWPGTYFIDDIRATARQTDILERNFERGEVSWTAIQRSARYRLQESLAGPDGPWKTLYSGRETEIPFQRLSKSWLRVRWEETFDDTHNLPYASDWSDVTEYRPAAVALNYANLSRGRIRWTAIPQTATYEIQSAPGQSGPWAAFYKGDLPLLPLFAQKGSWYRIRGIQETNGRLEDLTPWSRPQRYAPGEQFVRSSGTVLREANGTGDTVAFHGVNLGSLFVIEPWMTGLGQGDTPPLPDDWSIREKLIPRFGQGDTNRLMAVYQQAYAQEFDFDRLLDQGVTLVRIPIYYRNFQDDEGNWIVSPALGAFRPLDRVINELADRGIYTMIDLHGAPGLQSADATTGRAGFNKLFAPDGEIYRQRTENLWREIAAHYRTNPWVLGYDLLNEPLGAAPHATALAGLYDRLYRAVRQVDPNHLIVMEGIWYSEPTGDGTGTRWLVDWDTLPPPADRGWTNVMYQFHFYHWEADENFASHKAFMDQKLAEAAVKQPAYNVPVMIGEFYGFNLKSTWEYYLDSFNSRGWSWTSWSYKYHDSPSTWGLVAHAGYNEPLPDFGTDSYETLTRKISKYRTADMHEPTWTLQETLQSKGLDLASSSGSRPWLSQPSFLYLKPGQEFQVTGRQFGAAQNGSQLQFSLAPLQILSWSDRAIRARVNTFTPPGAGVLTVQTPQGTSQAVDLVVLSLPAPPVLTTTGGSTFMLQGSNFGDIPGQFQFYPIPCPPDIPTGFRACNNGFAGISFWSDTQLRGSVPPDAADLSSRFNVYPNPGGELYPTMVPR